MERRNNRGQAATSRQLWALRCATGVDYRGRGLTKEEASRLLQEANAASGYRKSTTSQKSSCGTIKTSTIKNEFIRKYEEAFNDIVEVVYDFLKSRVLPCESVVELEADGKKKQYLFVGCGCGFARLRYDKRRKTIKDFDEYVTSNKQRSRLMEAVLSKFPDEVRKQYRDWGTPLEAVMSQDLLLKNEYLWECAKIVNLAVGGGAVWVDTYDD